MATVTITAFALALHVHGVGRGAVTNGSRDSDVTSTEPPGRASGELEPSRHKIIFQVLLLDAFK